MRGLSRWLPVVGGAMLLLPALGCAPSLESKLVGRWKLDTSSVDMEKIIDEQIKQQTQGNAAAAALAEGMKGMLQGMMQSVQMSAELEFRADHTLQSKGSMSGLGQSKEIAESGTWKVEAVGDNQLTVALTGTDGKTNTVTVKFLDDNTATMAGSVPGLGDQQVKFTRIVAGA